MTRQTLHLLRKPSVGALALLALSVALAAPPAAPPEAKKDRTEPGMAKTEEEARREAEKVVRGIDLEVLKGDQWVKAERIEKPLLFYTEPSRNNDRGSVWGWGRKGRPLALIELFQDSHNRTRWVFALCNTSGGKVRASRGDAPWWRENDSALEVKDIPGAPAPAAEAPLRRRQLKLLAEKFKAHEFWDPDHSRFELRLLKQPLHTYRDEASGLLDGGLFILANGTNPEIPLFIEARVDPRDRSRRVWQYAVGRLAHAELHLEYDGKEVFQAPRGEKLSAANRPYWCAYLQLAADAEP